MTHDRIGYQLAIKRIDVPARHLDILSIQLHKLYLFLRLVDDLMDEELSLDIDQLPVRDPGDHLIDEHLLALLKNGTCPILDPKASFLHCFPEDIDNHSTAVFLSDYPLDNLPHLLHDQLELRSFCLDVSKGEVLTGEVAAFDGQDQILVLL